MSSIDTVCGISPGCGVGGGQEGCDFSTIQVHGATPSESDAVYSDFEEGDPPPYVENTSLGTFLSTLVDLIVAACDPDAGGGNPATCVPLDAGLPATP